MATDGKVLRWNNVEYVAVDERRLNAVNLMPAASAAPFGSRGGRRVNGAGLAVSVGGGPEAWTVTPGAGVIYDTTYSSQGAYPFEIPSAVTATMPARPGSGLSRIDLIVARIYDVDISVGSASEVKIEIVAGTAASSPTAPSVPPLSLVLAALTVPNTGSIVVTANTTRAVAAGGILPVATTAERDALPNPWNGLTVADEQTGLLEYRMGADWKALQAVTDTGWENCTLTGSWTGTCKARMLNGMVEVRFDLTGGSAANSSSINSFSTLPAEISIPVNSHARGAGVASGFSVGCYVLMSTGAIGFANYTGATRTAIAGSVLYLAG